MLFDYKRWAQRSENCASMPLLWRHTANILRMGTRLLGFALFLTVLAELATAQIPQEVRLPRERILVMACAPDGSSFAAGGEDGTVWVWNWNGTLICSAAAHKKPIYALAYSPESSKIATAGSDRTIRLLNSKNALEAGIFSGHLDIVTSLVFAPNDATMISGSLDGDICCWDLTRHKPSRKFKAHSAGVTSLSISQDGKLLVSTGYANHKYGNINMEHCDSLYVWNPQNHQRLRFFNVLASMAVISPDNSEITYFGERVLVTADAKGSVIIDQTKTHGFLRLDDGKPEVRLPHNKTFDNIAYLPNGSFLATINSRRIQIWDAATGKEAHEFVGLQADKMVFSPDGSRIAFAQPDGVIAFATVPAAFLKKKAQK